MKNFLKILLIFFVCFNLTAQQTVSDKLYREVSLAVIKKLYVFQNANPMLDPESFLNNFSEDAKILNDIPSLHIGFGGFYKNSSKINPGKYVQLIINDFYGYDPSSIYFDLIIREIGDLELIGDQEGFVTVYATKKRDGWKMNVANGNKHAIEINDDLDLEFELYFLDSEKYYRKEIDRIENSISQISESEKQSYNPEYTLLTKALSEAKDNLTDKIKNPGSYHIEIKDISLSKKEKGLDFGYSAKSKDLVKKQGPIIYKPSVVGIFASKKKKQLDLLISKKNGRNQECLDTIKSPKTGYSILDADFCEESDGKIKISADDDELAGTIVIDVDKLNFKKRKQIRWGVFCLHSSKFLEY